MGNTNLKIAERDLKGDCNRLNRRFDIIESLLGNRQVGASTTAALSGFSGDIQVLDILLTVATTPISAPLSGSIFLLIARQDGVGGRAITLSADFVAADPNIDMTANTISTRLFFKVGAFWLMASRTDGMV